MIVTDAIRMATSRYIESIGNVNKASIDSGINPQALHNLLQGKTKNIKGIYDRLIPKIEKYLPNGSVKNAYSTDVLNLQQAAIDKIKTIDDKETLLKAIDWLYKL